MGYDEEDKEDGLVDGVILIEMGTEDSGPIVDGATVITDEVGVFDGAMVEKVSGGSSSGCIVGLIVGASLVGRGMGEGSFSFSIHSQIGLAKTLDGSGHNTQVVVLVGSPSPSSDFTTTWRYPSMQKPKRWQYPWDGVVSSSSSSSDTLSHNVDKECGKGPMSLVPVISRLFKWDKDAKHPGNVPTSR
jgi:hypothetical protein